jgi:hypothetical protein
MKKVDESILVTAATIEEEGGYDGNGRSWKVMEGHRRKW